MTTPVPVLYASTSELRLVLDGTDAGTGTAAQLSDEQLSLALQAATDRVAVYSGLLQDTGNVPGIAHDLCLDLAAWWATTYYLKQKNMDPTHPVQLRYTAAMALLESVRKGDIDLEVPTASGSSAAAGGKVINLIPNIFTPADSNTRYDSSTGYLESDVPPDMVGRRSLIDDLQAYP